jgi:hypothetical protein
MRNSNFGFPRVLPTSSVSAEPSPKRRRIGEATDPPPEMREEALERLRGVVRDSAGKHLYTSAIFLADKVAAATGDPGDVYMLAQALFLGRQFRRALHLLNNSRLLRDLRFRFLAAKCLVRLLRTPPPPPGAVSSPSRTSHACQCGGRVLLLAVWIAGRLPAALNMSTFRQAFWANTLAEHLAGLLAFQLIVKNTEIRLILFRVMFFGRICAFAQIHGAPSAIKFVLGL